MSKRYTVRAAVLDEAKSLTTGDRNVTYGPPDADFSRTAGMLNELFQHKLKEGFSTADIAKIVICIKLSRSVWNDKRDNYVDIAGYAACGCECMELEKERASKQPPQLHSLDTAEPCDGVRDNAHGHGAETYIGPGIGQPAPYLRIFTPDEENPDDISSLPT